MRGKRAIGATAFGLMSIAFGLMGLIGSLSLYFSKNGYIDWLAILALLQIIIGLGLILLRDWARRLAVIFYSLFLIIMLPLTLYFEKSEIIFSDKIPQWILAFALVYFLSRPRVREQFRK